MDKCGNGWYNSSTQFCQSGTNAVKNLCGGDTYASTQECCGSSKYTLATQFCQSGTNAVKNLCGGDTYASTQECCGSSKYTLATQFCQSGTNAVKSLCGGDTYASTQECCGSSKYTLATQFCQSGTNAVKNFCGGTTTYISMEYCSNGTIKTYGTVSDGVQNYKTVVIGTQTWMAENLNYNASGSKCFGEDGPFVDSNNNAITLSNEEVQANCAKYGRLYNWSTAMGISSDYNRNLYNPSSSTKYRGICPSGWHIPNSVEWDKLYRSVDGTSDTSSPYMSLTAGRYLKAASGWNWYDYWGYGSSGNGTDEFGFSALPGGILQDNSSVDYGFYSAGNSGVWWSASELNAYNAHDRHMSYDGEFASYSHYLKSTLFSVRCLQD
jgi:uncharacterized protein (TIGR02145 family)